jgi:hypothetical protein
MDALDKFCTELGYPRGQQPAMVLCGDFNTVPDMGFGEAGLVPTAGFELLASGSLPGTRHTP